MEKILIVDDNQFIRYTLTELLSDAGFETKAVEDGNKALDEIKKCSYGLIVLDMKLPGMNGMDVLKKIRQSSPSTPVIILTAFGDIKNAVDAMKQGAQDYITKPFDNDAIILTIKKALEMKYLNKEVMLLRKKVDETFENNEVIGESKIMKDIFEQIKIVAPTNMSVLLEGESGTGKEVFARMIHRLSDRRDKAFVALDCGAIPELLLESELFGYEKGAFTDAKTDKVGKFEQANGGTIFLDEITNLSEANQMKLLRVLQERKIIRLGSNKQIDINVRIITAANIKLSEAVNEQNFRQDLYFRLNEYHIDLPPLRERREDIPLFIDYFIKEANIELNKNIDNVTDGVLDKVMKHSWPGNARELRNIIRRAVLLSEGNSITSVDIPDDILNPASKLQKLSQNIGSFTDSSMNAEKEIILRALNESNWNKSKAAKILNMNERTFYRKIKKLGL